MNRAKPYPTDLTSSNRTLGVLKSGETRIDGSSVERFESYPWGIEIHPHTHGPFGCELLFESYP